MTATSPDGIVHNLTDDGSKTLCGKDAASWSTAVTQLQVMGLVLFCEECKS